MTNIDELPVSNRKCSPADKWYDNPGFPLLPKIHVRNPDYYNTKSISFNWLFIKIWTRDAFDFEVAFVVDATHWGVGFTFLLPYLRVVLTLPIPIKIGDWVSKNLYRRSQQTKDLSNNNG